MSTPKKTILARQKVYNQRYRQKQSAIKRLAGELDAVVGKMESGQVDEGERQELHTRAEKLREELMIIDH